MLADARQILLVGGSFDPPHVAHGRLPQAVARAIAADAVAYIPVGRQPQKQGVTSTPPPHRLAMLRAMLADLADAPEPGDVPADVLTLEIDRLDDGRPSYTVETLQALTDQWDDAPARRPTYRWLMGADQAANFHTWREPERIERLAEPVVVLRPPWDADGLLAHLTRTLGDDAPARWRQRLVEAPWIDVSSTAIRRRVAAGLPIGGLVTPSVEAYIHGHGLYRA